VQVAPVIVTVAEMVPPGSRLPPQVGVVDEGEHPVTGYENETGGFPEIGTSPVFFNTIAKVAAYVADGEGLAINLTWSIAAVGLLPATLARLKKTPETTTAAATVIAISSITATNGLKPSDLLLCRLISFSSCVKSFKRLPFGVVLMYGVRMRYWILQPISLDSTGTSKRFSNNVFTETLECLKGR
jgi:hypothetical protein